MYTLAKGLDQLVHHLVVHDGLCNFDSDFQFQNSTAESVRQQLTGQPVLSDHWAKNCVPL